MANSIDWDALETLARQAREHAYAPYSAFKVGAAVLTGSGKIYGGANVENASYGLTSCAERNAIASAIGSGERQFDAVAIVADTPGPCMPCGACRQFMAEFAANLPILCVGAKEAREQTSLERLLPSPFLKPENV